MTVLTNRPLRVRTGETPSPEEQEPPGIFLSSVLQPEYLPDLESLLFYNPLQRRVESGIVKSLENFGMPEVLVEANKVRIQVKELPGLQTLYAFETNAGTSHALGNRPGTPVI